MKKLLLCTLIMAFVSVNTFAKPTQKTQAPKPKTPTLDALEKRQDELDNKIGKLYSTKKLYDLIEQDAQIKEIDTQFKDPKNNSYDLYQKMDQRKKEIAYSLNPELKAYEEEINKISAKLGKIEEDPKVQELTNKKRMLATQREEEQRNKIKESDRKKIDQIFKEAKNIETAYKKMTDFIHQINPKIAEIDKQIDALNKKSRVMAEKVLREINKKEAAAK